MVGSIFVLSAVSPREASSGLFEGQTSCQRGSEYELPTDALVETPMRCASTRNATQKRSEGDKTRQRRKRMLLHIGKMISDDKKVSLFDRRLHDSGRTHHLHVWEKKQKPLAITFQEKTAPQVVVQFVAKPRVLLPGNTHSKLTSVNISAAHIGDVPTCRHSNLPRHCNSRTRHCVCFG